MNLVALTSNDLLSRFVKNLDLRGITPGNLMVSLHSGFPGSTGESEASGTYYARQTMLCDPATGGEIANANQLQFFKRTPDTIITRTLAYSDNFNRANVGYCSGSIGPNWRVHTGCAGIETNRLKMGLNVAQPVRVSYDFGVPALTGQYSTVRVRSWRLRPQLGIALMSSPTVNPTLSGYTMMIHPGPSPGIIDPVVRVYRPSATSSQELLAQQLVPGHPAAEWTFTAIPFVDHTFLQVQREGNTAFELDDYSPYRLGSGFQGLNVRHDLYGGVASGWDVFMDDWEAGGASLSVDGGGGSPNILITHVGFWTPDQSLFLGSAKFNSLIHLLTNQLLTIEIGDLKLSVTNGAGIAADAYKDKHLDRFGRGVNFTTAPVQMSLHTADPGTTGADEISGSRISVATDSWTIADQQTTTNARAIDFPQIATTVVTHLGVWSIDGEFMFGVELSSPIAATLPLQTVRFLAGRLKFLVPSSAIGFLTAAGTSTVQFSGVGIAVGAATMAGIGAAAFNSAAVNVGAMSAAGSSTAAFTGVGTFPGWSTWTNRNGSATGFNRFISVADNASRIYYSPANAVDGNSRFVSLLKSNLTSFTTHTMPANRPGLTSIVPMDDDDTVFLGSSSTGNNASMWKFTHSGGFTTLTNPAGFGADAIFWERHPTDTNLLFMSNQSGGANDVRLYTYDIGANTFTKIGGTGLNGSWNVSGSSRAIGGITFDGTFIYVVESGGSTNNLNVWRATIGSYTDWTRIAGAALNSSWATGTKRNGVLKISPLTGKLYAFIGGGAAGDAEVWVATTPGATAAWSQIGGDSINSSWAAGNWVNCSRVARRSNRLVTNLSGTASGDSDVWEYDELAGAWTQIGGDSIGSGWSNRQQCNAIYIDIEDRLWTTISDNSTGTPSLWSKSVA